MESTELCGCKDARWRRGECVDCGRPTGPRKGPALGKQRCPEHELRRRRKLARDCARRHYPARAEKERKRCREYRRRRMAHPRFRLRMKAVKRERYLEELRVRGKQPKRLPDTAREMRDRIIYRLRETEGWQLKEIGDAFGLNWTWVWQIVRRESERRQQVRAA